MDKPMMRALIAWAGAGVFFLALMALFYGPNWMDVWLIVWAIPTAIFAAIFAVMWLEVEVEKWIEEALND